MRLLLAVLIAVPLAGRQAEPPQAAARSAAVQSAPSAAPAVPPAAQSTSPAPAGTAPSAPQADQSPAPAAQQTPPAGQSAAQQTPLPPAGSAQSASPAQQSPPAAQQTPPAGQSAAQQTSPASPAQSAPPATPAAGSQTAAPAEASAPKAENPAPSTEDWLTGSVDFGYRWLTDIRGNLDEYRSVVNLGQGPKLFGLDMTVTDPKKRLFDRLTVRAFGWGGDPYTTAHLDARKQGIYDLVFDYRNIIYFNATPSYANAFAPGGFDEQSFDEHRRNYSLSLDLFPGKRIIPYLAVERNSGYGHDVETWVQQSNDDFPIEGLLRDSTMNYRGGVRFEFNRWHVTLEQGGTEFKDDDQAYFRGDNPGDNTTPLLGGSLALYGLAQAYGIRGHGPYSKALVTAAPASWIHLYGQFLYSEPRSSVNFNEAAYGNFLLESSLLFYGGQQTVGVGAAVQPHVTGTGGFELTPLKRLRIMESVTADRSHDAVSPLITASLIPGSFASALTNVTSLNYSQVINYTQEETDLMYDLTNKITLRGGYRMLRGDSEVLPSVLDQTGGNLLTGALRRDIALAGATYRATGKLSVTLDYEGSSSDHIYFRTDLNDYHKARARARYQVSNALSIQANFQVLNNQNPASQIQYSFQSRDNAVSIFWMPGGGKRITFTGEYDRSTLHSSIDYLLPPFYTPSVSLYRDNAHTATSAMDVALPGIPGAKIEVGGSLFISSGSRASQYYQPLARLSIPFGKHLQWNTQWRWYGYEEQFYLYEGFRTHEISTGLRYSR